MDTAVDLNRQLSQLASQPQPHPALGFASWGLFFYFQVPWFVEPFVFPRLPFGLVWMTLYFIWLVALPLLGSSVFLVDWSHADVFGL